MHFSYFPIQMWFEIKITVKAGSTKESVKNQSVNVRKKDTERFHSNR